MRISSSPRRSTTEHSVPTLPTPTTFWATSTHPGTGRAGGAVRGAASRGSGRRIVPRSRPRAASVARQPEAAGRIGTNMLITAAMVEGVALAAVALGFALALRI